MSKTVNQLAIIATTQAVRLSTRHAWFVILAFLLGAVLSALYFTSHFAITTDSNKLLSNSLPWRQQERALDRAFPWRVDQIIAVVDAATPEAAEEAADTLANDLSRHSDVIRTVSRPDGGEFFAQNGILFRSLDEVRRDANDLIGAQPFLGTLSADPTLRGVLRTLSQSIEGLRLGKTKLEDLRPALAAIADALEALSNGKHPAFFLAQIDNRADAGAFGAPPFHQHPAGPGLRRSAARAQSDRGHTRGGVAARTDA